MLARFRIRKEVTFELRIGTYLMCEEVRGGVLEGGGIIIYYSP